MKIINLTNVETSDIKFEVSHFPDGQQQVKILGNMSFINGVFRKEDEPITIKARLNNFLDLELIACTVASLRELGVEKICLYIGYFLGARSDRKFEDGSNNYLKTVICPIINSLGFASVTVLDPHSDVLEACIKNFKKIDNTRIVEYTLYEIYKDLCDGNFNNDKYLLISPDAGALKKVYNVAEKIGYTGDIVIASKHRDLATGKITHTEVPLKKLEYDKDFILIDDICDGGRTFVEIAKAIYKLYDEKEEEHPRIYLIVTHGIFSAGFEELAKYFDGIYCTNSYSDLPKWQQNGEKIITANSGINDFIKQLNIF